MWDYRSVRARSPAAEDARFQFDPAMVVSDAYVGIERILFLFDPVEPLVHPVELLVDSKNLLFISDRIASKRARIFIRKSLINARLYIAEVM